MPSCTKPRKRKRQKYLGFLAQEVTKVVTRNIGSVKVLSRLWSRRNGSQMLRVARSDKIIARIAGGKVFHSRRHCKKATRR